MKTLIVVPTYNECENIASIVSDIFQVLPGTDLLIIDDNSSDGTGQIADDLSMRDARVHVLHRPGKLGLGTAYLLGFRYAIDHSYDFVFEMDADYSHGPEYLPSLLKEAQHADAVLGSRYVPGGSTPDWPRSRRFISKGGNLFARSVLGLHIQDCTAGYRCYRTAALEQINLEAIKSQGYAFQVEMTYIFWRKGFRIREIPIVFPDRRLGTSKMSRKIFIEAFVWVLQTRFLGNNALKKFQKSKASAIVKPENPQFQDEQATSDL